MAFLNANGWLSQCEYSHRKFCQLKLGPNTINKDDVETIDGHFQTAKRLALANGRRVSLDDLVVAVIYGEEKDVSSHYKRLRDEKNYKLLVGADFWHHLTGDVNFYQELLESIVESAKEAEVTGSLDETVSQLSKKPAIKKLVKG